jgi:SAM-dependent methyltransferase
MSDVTPLFDRAALRLHAARAKALAAARPGADYLLVRACDDFAARLATINRTFADCLDWMTPDARLAALVAQRSGTRVFRAARVPRADAALVADSECVPFAADSFDLVVSALALQWCDDLPGVLSQIRACLRPDGLLVACLVGGRTLHELRSSFSIAEAEIEGGASPHVIPFVDLRDLGALLQRAGFTLPVTDVDPLVVRYDSMFDLMADLRAMGATNVLRQRRRTFMRRRTLLRAAEIYASSHADPDGRIRATFELVWLSGWAPHHSQQKPLAPGSATMSLAEALGATERGVKRSPEPLEDDGN